MAEYSIAEADLRADGDAIQSVWASNLSCDREGAAAKLGLGYLNNPAGTGVVLLLRTTAEPGPKGTLGLHPRRLHLGSQIVNAIALADFAVDSEHRSLGPAMMLMRKGIEYSAERCQITYGLPNHRAAPVFAACKLQRFADLQRFAKSLRSLPYLSRHLPGWLARIAAPVIDLALRGLDQVRKTRQRSDLTCRATTWDDPVFDQLWTKRSPEILVSERSAAMLNWRFGQAGRVEWKVCAAHDQNGESCGYVVWRDTRGFVEVGDFATDAPELRTAPLMMAFTRFIRDTGAHAISVEFSGPAHIAAQLQASGLRRRPEEWPVFVGSTFLGSLASAPEWLVTAFDNDAD